MSAIILSNIQCDRCGAKYLISPNGNTVTQLRKEYRSRGWRKYPDEDVCGNCRHGALSPKLSRITEEIAK